MIDPHESNRSPFIPDRRNYGRQKVSFSSVVISENNRGRVLNISPNGLALQTDTELVDDELPIRFNFSQLQPWVEARGRIAWRSASRKVAGIEFVHPADEVCAQIRMWIASQSDLSESPKSMSVESAQNVTSAEANSEMATAIPARASGTADLIAENRDQSSTFSQAWSSDETQESGTVSETVIAAANATSRSGKAGHLIGPPLVAVLLLLAFLGLRYHLQKVGNRQKGREMTAKPNLPALSSKTSTAPTSNVGPSLDHPASTPNTGPSLGHPTFVLQVGAMIHEENANALAESLSELNFPAFVFTRPTDRFHRVLVGPYNNADAAIHVQNELEKRGFKAIRTKWKATSVDSPQKPTSD